MNMNMNIYILKSSFGYIVSLRDRDFIKIEEIHTKQTILNEISRINMDIVNEFYKDVTYNWKRFYEDATNYNCEYIKWNCEPIFTFKNEDDALAFKNHLISMRVLKQLGEA
jgi:hypothetical protein